MAKAKKNHRKRILFQFSTVVTLLVIAGLIYLDAQVRYKLNDRQWEIPARVYSRPLQIVEGRFISAEDLQAELGLLGYRSNPKWRRPGTYWRENNQFWIYSRGFDHAGARHKPKRFRLKLFKDEIVLLEAAGGSDLAQVYLEPLEIGSIYPRHREDRMLLRLEEVPSSLIEILLLIEDRDFYQHYGLSMRSIARALLANIQAGRTVQGGSTLTQQLVKNVFLNQRRSLSRKSAEALMSLLVELHYSKDQILESYLNEVYLGQEGPRAIHGVALASQHYFNRPLAELNAGQIALLVGMIKGPSYFDPWRHPERAIERRNLVLDVMAEQQVLDYQLAASFQQRGLELAKSSAVAGVYPAYLDLVRRQLRRDYSASELESQGMKIFTAFDPVVQRHAEQSLADQLAVVDPAVEGAMVVTDVANGDVLAVVGGRRARYAGFNRALDAVRPIGSLIKPAVYLTALEQPAIYTLATPISDGPVEVRGRDGSLWQPRNFDRRDHGEVLLHKALSQSYNQATARLGMQLGLDNVLATVKRLGVDRKLPEVPAVLLGAGALSPMEVAAMYQTIASGGLQSPLRAIVDISDQSHRVLARYPVRQQQVVEPPAMHLLNYSLMEVVHEGTGKSVYQRLPEEHSLAGKTGTTNDLRDSWFAGYAGDYLAVVWMGRDDNKSAGLTGASGALKVWREFMAGTSHRPVAFEAPPGIAYHWVDNDSGLRSRGVCENTRYVPFLQGSAPERRADCETSLPGLWQWFRGLVN